MNYLTKIIFINSATIKYAEINLNGHVHLIGTQGVGKSTILRAILFFYNADLNKLGLTGKQSYTDYYFPYPESYIIYEVARPEGAYCVISYKAQQRVVFRFMDAAYSKTFFISENGWVPNEWKGIANHLDDKKVFYSKQQIDSYTEYKNILYGANTQDKNKNEWKRYALLKSELYQNIPKTIQNVFLNAKLDAAFIKQTLIDSLESENPIEQIPLKLYRNHFKNFNAELKDFDQFKLRTTMDLTDKISKNYKSVRFCEQEQRSLVKSLIWAMAQLELRKPQLSTQLSEADLYKKKNLKDQADLEEAHTAKVKTFNDVIAVQTDLLNRVGEKRKYYTKLGIQSIIEKVQRKKEFESEREALKNEYTIWMDNSRKIGEKYDLLLTELENEWKKYENDKNGQKNQLEAHFLDFRTEQEDNAARRMATIEATYAADKRVLSLESKSKNDNATTLGFNKIHIKNESFFKVEIEAAVSEVSHQENIVKYAADGIEAAQRQVKQWILDLQKDEKEMRSASDLKQQQVAFSLSKPREALDTLMEQLRNRQNALYGWLTKHYPNWENTIGKVIQDNNEVLFNPHLSPRFAENQQNLSFYGIELELNAIERKIKTVTDYELDKLNLEKQIEMGEKSIKDLQSTLCNEIDHLNKEYGNKIKKENASIEALDYKKSQAFKKSKEAKIALEALKKKANEQKNQRLQENQALLTEAKQQAKRAEEALQQRTNAYREQKKKCETAKNEAITAEKNIKINNIEKIEGLFVLKQKEHKKKKQALKDERDTQLSNAGTNTKRLEDNRKRFKILNNGLDYIEEHQKYVTLYENDKTEYLDKAVDFETTQKQAQTDLEAAKLKLEDDKRDLEKNLNGIKTNIKRFEKEITTITQQQSIVQQFQYSEVYEKWKELFETPTEAVATKQNCEDLTNALQRSYQTWKAEWDEMKKNMRIFLDLFSEDNVFQFKKQLDSVHSFFQSVESLMSFIEERKIEAIERSFNQRFANILKIIGAEIQGLVAREEALKKIIVQINRDLNNRDFASVIKEIRLEITDNDEDSTVRVLKTIRTFNEEHITPLNEQNLFPVHEATVHKAIGLAKKLIHCLDKDKREAILLSDCFKLQFRVKENNNDTDWVDSLSKVGSEGTEKIVKALLNIVLLNVFKNEAANRAKTFQLHCMIDEIGMLHPTNMRGILNFAAERNIFLINGSPIATDAQAYKNIYILEKDNQNFTKVKRLLTTQIE